MYRAPISIIREAIEKGNYNGAFSRLMNDRMKWDKYSPRFRAQYLVDQLGVENIKRLYFAYKQGFLVDARIFSERRVKVLREAYEAFCK